MAKITGLGGAFLRAADPKAVYAWHEQHLGIQRRARVYFPARNTESEYCGVVFFEDFRLFSGYAAGDA